jgi:hypothetical protein
MEGYTNKAIGFCMAGKSGGGFWQEFCMAGKSGKEFWWEFCVSGGQIWRGILHSFCIKFVL